VLAEPDAREPLRTEVPVDHAHRRVAEHRREWPLRPHTSEDVVDDTRLDGRGRVVDAPRVVIDRSRLHPRVERVHEPLVRRQVGCVRPQSAVRAPEAGEARARVEQPDEAGPRTVEVRREEQRRVVADDAVGRVRSVDPVGVETDHRVVDARKRVDRVGGRGEEAVEQLGLVPERAQRTRERGDERVDVRSRELVGDRPVVTRQEAHDAATHG
jgi:hypothetical protein